MWHVTEAVKKNFPYKKLCLFTFKEMLLKKKKRDCVWLKVFIQYKAQKPDEGIFNFYW